MRPTFTALALACLASGTFAIASTTYTGHITVTNEATNQVVGYVSRALNAAGTYSIVLNPSNALTVTFTEGSSPFDISLDSPADPNFAYFGAVDGANNTSTNLDPGSSNYAYLAESNATASGAKPANVGNSFSATTGVQEDSESAIWVIDPLTGQLTAEWVNSGGATPATFGEYSEGTLVITGGPIAFESTYGGSLVELSIPGVATTPEPSTFLLLGTGVMGLAGVARRRLKA